MAGPLLKAVTAVHATAFRSLCDWIARDTTLKPAVKIIRSWKGEQMEDSLPSTITQLPWVRLTPEMGPFDPLCLMPNGKRSWLCPLDVTIETAVEGSFAEDSIKLWAAIFDRVMTWDHATNSVSDVLPLMPAQTINDSDLTIGKGKVRLEIYVTG